MTSRYEKAIVAMAKQCVTLEVLSYHATAPVEEAYRLTVTAQFSFGRCDDVCAHGPLFFFLSWRSLVSF